MLRSYIQKANRTITSAYYNLSANHLHLEDGVYMAHDGMVHYSERCGWKAFGAKDETEYNYWWQEACGIASLRMILDTLRPNESKSQTIFAQIQGAIQDGAYLQKTVNDEVVRIGWIHSELAKIAKRRKIHARPAQLNVLAICKALSHDQLVMASIYRPVARFIDENAARKKAGGHLVAVYGFTWENGHCTGLYIADPYDTEARDTPIDVELFSDIYSGAAILFYK